MMVSGRLVGQPIIFFQVFFSQSRPASVPGVFAFGCPRRWQLERSRTLALSRSRKPALRFLGLPTKHQDNVRASRGVCPVPFLNDDEKTAWLVRGLSTFVYVQIGGCSERLGTSMRLPAAVTTSACSAVIRATLDLSFDGIIASPTARP